MKKKQEVRQVMYEQIPALRTLVVHHADFLGHITRGGHQESPQRVIAIIENLKKVTSGLVLCLPDYSAALAFILQFG